MRPDFCGRDRIDFELSGRRKIMKDATEDRFFSLNPQLFQVVSIYDDADTRERAMRLCDYLVKLLWEDAELKFSWWRTDFFRDDGLSKMAAGNVMTADFIILSSRNHLMLSPELEAWFENRIDWREANEGILVDLVPAGHAGRGQPYREGFLQRISQKLKIDFLTVTVSDGEISSEPLIDFSSYLSQRGMHSQFGINE